MKITAADEIRAHSYGIFLNDAQQIERLKQERDFCLKALTDSQIRLSDAVEYAERMRKRWAATFGFLLGAILVIMMMVAGKWS